MPKVKFGANQIKNPVPSKIGIGIDICSGIMGAVISWLTTVSFIPSSVSNVISSILGLIITIAQILKPFFGIQTNQKNVPVEDVQMMDND